MSILSKIFGDSNEKELKKLQPIVETINHLEPKFEKLTDQGLIDQTSQFKKRLEQGESLDQILPEAFALVREAAKRNLGQRHYDVQLIGGLALHQGKITEMKTGEGKTLASTLPVYLNALAGKGVHLVTVNDYLAKRDAVWMGQVYHALGLSISCIAHDTAFIYDPAYVETLTDQPENEIDQERDRVGSFKVEEAYLRPVSRRESYLADITYGTNNEFGFDYLRDNLIQDSKSIIQRDLYYAIVDEIDSILIDEARTPLIISAQAEESANLYYQLSRLVNNLKRTEDYAVDEKMRAVTLTEGGIDKMAVFLGEDPWANSNFTLVHHIDAALKAKVLFQKDRDYVIKDGEIIIVDEFTGRLMIGRRYSEGLHQAIEAKENVEVKKESRTIATITFQNYFRYYQKLAGMTGTAATEAEEFNKIYKLEVLVIPTNKELIRQDFPDRIYRTKEAKFKAIIEEIKERHQTGQPILVGTGGFSIGEQTVGAIEKNKIIKDMLEKEGISCEVLDATNHEKEGQIIAQAGRLGAITVATNMAGRGVDIVLGGNPSDLSEQKKVLKLGGLHIIGTERHESRRIDNQLRGRAGRQGDPGSSLFFISMEDDLMRIFGGSRLSGIMETLKVPEDFPIESRVVSKSIEASQKKVEGFNFDTRKHLLEYDDVLNKHRETIYRRRKNILKMDPEGLKKELLKIIETELKKIVDFHTRGDDEHKWEIKGIVEIVKTIFPIPENLTDALEDIQRQAGDEKSDGYARNRLAQYLIELAFEAYADLEKKIEELNQDGRLSQGGLVLKQPLSIITRSILLQSIDRYWVYHLEVLSNLKGGIGLRAYGQHDPLVEYKKESFKKFNELMEAVNKQVVFSIYKVGMIERMPQQPSPEMKLSAPVKISRQAGSVIDEKGGKKKKIGRNDPCPCGSGKKYKRCHG